MMNTWWLAIDKNQGSITYEELKRRCVIAQGWPQLGDLAGIVAQAAQGRPKDNPNNPLLNRYDRSVESGTPDPDERRKAADTIYHVLQICQGDIVIGMEGTTPRGIARAPIDAVKGYRFDSGYNYSHVVADEVVWIDLPKEIADRFSAPQQGIQGVRHVRKDRELALKVWGNIDAIRLQSILDENEDGLFTEGAIKKAWTTKYERNQNARMEAIRIHGTTCKACGFNFTATYGCFCKDYIEVHHMRPISQSAPDIPINPATDLTVLCANCHRMIHRNGKNVLSLEELRSLIEQHRKAT